MYVSKGSVGGQKGVDSEGSVATASRLCSQSVVRGTGSRLIFKAETTFKREDRTWAPRVEWALQVQTRRCKESEGETRRGRH